MTELYSHHTCKSSVPGEPKKVIDVCKITIAVYAVKRSMTIFEVAPKVK